MIKTLCKKFKFLKNYDLFGHPITLSWKEKTFYKTVFGGLVSFLIEIGFIILICFSISNLLTNQYVQTSNYEITLIETFGKLSLNQKELGLAIKFDNDVLNNWTTPFMSISLVQAYSIRTLDKINKSKINVPLKPCQIEDFKEFQNEFQKFGLAKALCPEKNVTFSLIGTYEENIFEYIQIKVSVCNAANCQTNETIQKIVQNIGFYFNFFIYLYNK